MIKIEELVKLKEQGMSDDQIAQHFRKQGIEIKRSTVASRLIKYYKEQGKEKPRCKSSGRKISTEELAKLKDQGMTDYEIVKELEKQGIKISVYFINSRLREYYKSQGKEKPRGKSGGRRITIEELVELKEQRMTDEEIAQYFLDKRGIEIKTNTVAQRLYLYYREQGKEKPKPKSKKSIIEEELVRLKEQGMTDYEIAEKLTKQGRKISGGSVSIRLREYYKLQGKEKPKGNRNLNFKKIYEDKKEYDNPIKQILMNGITVEEKFPNEEEQVADTKEILEKLKIIALYSEKAEENWLHDYDFATVIKYASGRESISELESNIKPLVKGKIARRRVTFIKDYYLGGNPDLTTYILSRLNLSYDIYSDDELELYRKQYEEKIDKYLERLQIVENGRRKNKENSKITNNDTIPEER